MQRRDALRIFAAGAVLPVFSPELFALFRQAQPPPGYSLRTLTRHLNDTVVAMAEQIIPATDTPGAKGARVNEFIDVILTEWATPDERAPFLMAWQRSTGRAGNFSVKSLPKLLPNSNSRRCGQLTMQLSPDGAPKLITEAMWKNRTLS